MNISGLKIYIVATIIYLAIGIYGVFVLYKIDQTLNKVNETLSHLDGKI